MHTHTHTLTPTHSQTHSQRHTHTQIQTHTHKHRHTDKQAVTKRHRQKHARTHTIQKHPSPSFKTPHFKTPKYQSVKKGHAGSLACRCAITALRVSRKENGMGPANAQTRARASGGVKQNLTVLRLSVPGQQLRIEIRRIILVEHLRLSHTTFIVSTLKLP